MVCEPTPVPPTAVPPTPVPPPNPTGSIEAEPETLLVDQTTTITASASDDDLDLVILAIDTSVLNNPCDSGIGRGDPGVVFTACGAGSTQVKLWDATNNKTLAQVTVEVLPTPRITSDTPRAYRWFDITWDAHSDFTSFVVKWRNANTAVDFSPLGTSGVTGARALLEANGAAIRGLPYKNQGVDLILVATTAGRLEATSAEYTASRGPRPDASGHLPDHTMNYILTGLDDEIEHALLAGWVRSLVPTYAQRWANIMSTLQICKGGCQRNKDLETLSVDLGGCRPYDIACVDGNPKTSIEGTIDTDRTLGVVIEPIHGQTPLVWTRVKGLDGEYIRQAPLPDRRFIWIDSAIAHEMGHAFGLKDHHGNPRYDGIMDVNDTLFMGTDSIKQADKDVLIQAYTSHTINEGW